MLPDVEESPDHVGVADLAAVVPVRLPLQPVPATPCYIIDILIINISTYFFPLARIQYSILLTRMVVSNP